MLTVSLILVATLVAVALYDLSQRKHAILRNYPVIGHLRYLLESVGPELRQLHRDQQPGGAAVQPGSAAMGLRVVEIAK